MSETDDYMMLPIGWEPFVVRERHDLLSEMMRRIQPLSPPPYDDAGEGRSVPSLIERFRGLGQGDVVEAVSNGTILPAECIEFALVYLPGLPEVRQLARNWSLFKAETRSFLKEMWLYFDNHDTYGDPRPLDLEYVIPVAEVHCPTTTGSSAVYNVEASRKHGKSFHVKAWGIGAGGSCERTVTYSSTVDAGAGDCKALVAYAGGYAQDWMHLDTQTIKTVINVESITSTLSTWPLINCPWHEDQNHSCGKHQEYTEFEALVRAGVLTAGQDYEVLDATLTEGRGKMEIQVGRRFWFEIGVGGDGAALKKSDVESGIAIESTLVGTMACEWRFASGSLYLGRYVDRHGLPLEWLNP